MEKTYENENMRALEMATGRGDGWDTEATLCHVRRPTETEKREFVIEERRKTFLKLDEYSCQIDFGVAREFIKNRMPSGSIPGYANKIFLITEEEWKKLIAADKTLKSARSELQKMYAEIGTSIRTMELESNGVARICWAQKVFFDAINKFSDTIDPGVAAKFLKGRTPDGTFSPGGIAYIVTKGDWKQLLADDKAAKEALR